MNQNEFDAPEPSYQDRVWTVEYMDKGRWIQSGCAFLNVLDALYEVERLNLPDSKTRMLGPDGEII